MIIDIRKTMKSRKEKKNNGNVDTFLYLFYERPLCLSKCK